MKLKTTLLALAAVGILAGTSGCGQKKPEKTRIAMVVKNLGNGFFDAAHTGADEAAKQLGNVEVIYTGPTTPSAEGQIEIINALISQKVDAIVISANDPNALVPIAKKAMQRGIKVISFDSGIAPEGRQMQLNPSNAQLIGEKKADAAPAASGTKGQLAADKKADTVPPISTSKGSTARAEAR